MPFEPTGYVKSLVCLHDMPKEELAFRRYDGKLFFYNQFGSLSLLLLQGDSHLK